MNVVKQTMLLELTCTLYQVAEIDGDGCCVDSKLSSLVYVVNISSATLGWSFGTKWPTVLEDRINYHVEYGFETLSTFSI